jgi:hypothetical protein
MNNKPNTNETLNRMKTLMGYGLNENKQTQYSSVEYQKVGADGNAYAIIREGAKYYIKSTPNKQNLVKEDFQYIGGFRNRKENEYSSFANAQKQFDLKMMSLKEAANKQDFSVSSWDLDKKENVVVEASEKMRGEILREKQIMKNAMLISEKKGCDGIACDIADTQKPNMKGEEPKTGDATKTGDFEKVDLKKTDIQEGEQVLGWNRGNDEYMDKSHGTEIGDSAPFDDAEARNIDDGDKQVNKTSEMKNGTVEEGASMHDADNQNTPTVGVGEVGDNQPFDGEKGKQIDEGIEDLDGEGEALDADAEGEDALGDEGLDDDFDGEGEESFGDEEGEPIGDELGDDDLEGEDDVYEDDLESRVEAMEDLLRQIAGKLGVEEAPVDEEPYEGEPDDIFGDEEGEDEFGDEESFGDEEEPIDEMDFDVMPESRYRGGVQIYETKAFKNAMRRQRINEEGMKPFKDAGRVPSGNMNKLDDFGKHPAYQKKVMNLPPKDMQEFPGYYDMNDDSVRSDAPYGEKIGDGAPFEIDPQSIDNAIAEAFNRLRNKKKI